MRYLITLATAQTDPALDVFGQSWQIWDGATAPERHHARGSSISLTPGRRTSDMRALRDALEHFFEGPRSDGDQTPGEIIVLLTDQDLLEQVRGLPLTEGDEAMRCVHAQILQKRERLLARGFTFRAHILGSRSFDRGILETQAEARARCTEQAAIHRQTLRLPMGSATCVAEPHFEE